MQTNRERVLEEALRLTELWLTAALECKDWSWDADQHEAATWARDSARLALATPAGAPQDVEALASRSAPDAGWSNIAATALLQINNDASLDMAARKIAREALDKLPSLAATKEG